VFKERTPTLSKDSKNDSNSRVFVISWSVSPFHETSSRIGLYLFRGPVADLTKAFRRSCASRVLLHISPMFRPRSKATHASISSSSSGRNGTSNTISPTDCPLEGSSDLPTTSVSNLMPYRSISSSSSPGENFRVSHLVASSFGGVADSVDVEMIVCHLVLAC